MLVAYVSMRTYARRDDVQWQMRVLFPSIRQYADVCGRMLTYATYGTYNGRCASCFRIRQHTSAYVSIRQHTSAYDVSIRQHTSATTADGPPLPRICSIRPHTSAFVRNRPHLSAFVSIRQHTSAYVRIRQHTPPHQLPRARAAHQLRQYLYCGTSKASKLSTCFRATATAASVFVLCYQ
jgi:hypothetical protein